MTLDLTKLTADRVRPIVPNILKLIGFETRKVELLHEMMLSLAYQARPDATTHVATFSISALAVVHFGTFIQVHAIKHAHHLTLQTQGGDLHWLKPCALIVPVGDNPATADSFSVYVGSHYIGARRTVHQARALVVQRLSEHH